MRDGIEVFKLSRQAESGEEEKQTLGKSPKAGQMAVMQSAASRVFTNMQVGPVKIHPRSAYLLQPNIDHPADGDDVARETRRIRRTEGAPAFQSDQPDPQ